MQLDKAIKERKSVRKFKSKKPDWRDIIECIDAARYTPMAGGIYSLRFILVDDKEKIQKLAEACQQYFVATVNYVVVACSNPGKTLNSYGKQGKIYCRQQAGAGIQNFWLKLEEKGLSSCWVGAFIEEQIKDILKIPEDVDVEAVFPIGYEMGKKIRRPKINIDSILYFNEYKNKKMKKPRVAKV